MVMCSGVSHPPVPLPDVRPFRTLMDKAKYQAAIESFRKTMADHTHGWDNSGARSAMSSCLTSIRIAAGDMSLDGYCSIEVHNIERMVGDLFSPRKHLKYKSGSRSGVDVLRERIFSSIHKLATYPGMYASFNSLPQVS